MTRRGLPSNAMPKLRFAIILPILMGGIAFPASWWQARVDAQQLPKHEYPVVSRITSAYLEFNARVIGVTGRFRVEAREGFSSNAIRDQG